MHNKEAWGIFKEQWTSSDYFKFTDVCLIRYSQHPEENPWFLRHAICLFQGRRTPSIKYIRGVSTKDNNNKNNKKKNSLNYSKSLYSANRNKIKMLSFLFLVRSISFSISIFRTPLTQRNVSKIYHQCHFRNGERLRYYSVLTEQNEMF